MEHQFARTTSSRSHSLHLGMVSTYPPTMCGLATFTSALRAGLTAHGHVVDVVQVADSECPRTAHEVVSVVEPSSTTSVARAARALADVDVVIIQHEFGIFGPDDGVAVVGLVSRLTSPVVVVLHSVPANPSPRQSAILRALCRFADLIVVMSDCAEMRLRRIVLPTASQVVVIPHGAQVATHAPATSGSGSPRLLSWGLLGPGKGIEHAIEAVAEVVRRGRDVSYLIAGQTHPKVFAHSGNAYRDGLAEKARRLGIADHVTFDEQYRSVDDMTELIASSSLVLMAYDSRDQVTSGVLVDSLAAGTPVVATAFPHAVELLGSGGGILVPHGDVDALSEAIDGALRVPAVLARLTAEAATIGKSLDWSIVAEDYAYWCTRLLAHDEAVTA